MKVDTLFSILDIMDKTGNISNVLVIPPISSPSQREGED